MEALMSETVVDLDEAALAEAAQLYGTTTTAETVNTALREAAARRRRALALEELVKIAETGQFDQLLDKQTRP